MAVSLLFRESLGLHLMYSAPKFWLTSGLGHRPDNAPMPMIGIAYPRELVEHHLDIENMWARVLNIGIGPDEGEFGTIQGMRFITSNKPRYTNELDHYRQYPDHRS